MNRFPENPKLRNIWVRAVRRADWTPTFHSRLCSRHFDPSCFNRTLTDKTFLKETAVPTIFDFRERKVGGRGGSLSQKKKLQTQHADDISSSVEGFMWPVDGLWASIVDKELLDAGQLVKEDARVSKQNNEEEYIGSSRSGAPVLHHGAVDERLDDLRPVTSTLEPGCLPSNNVAALAGQRTPPHRVGRASSSEVSNSGADTTWEGQDQGEGKELDIAAFLAQGIGKVADAGPDGCLLCGRAAAGLGVNAVRHMGTTRKPLWRRLEVLAAEAGLQPPRGSLCSRCAHILQYAESIELELCLLRRTIAECICTKHHLCLPLPGGDLRYA